VFEQKTPRGSHPSRGRTATAAATAEAGVARGSKGLVTRVRLYVRFAAHRRCYFMSALSKLPWTRNRKAISHYDLHANRSCNQPLKQTEEKKRDQGGRILR
jgi:hypothetical protein